MENYKIISQLGHGSYVAYQDVCIKQISLLNLSNQQQLKILQEAAVLSSLHSDYIVSYIDSFIGENNLYLVMEYCENGDLYQYIKNRNGPLSEDEIWKFFIQSCVGLQYLHSQCILHRDLKTLNIFLTQDYNVRIGDLGVAKILNSSQSFANTLVGTPYYLAPEQLKGTLYNEKSDIWSLGCCLYEMCTKKYPFEALHQYGLVVKISRGVYAPVSTKYSQNLRSIIDLCLTKDTKKRPKAINILKLPFVQSKALQFNIKLPFITEETIIPKQFLPIKNKNSVPPKPIKSKSEPKIEVPKHIQSQYGNINRLNKPNVGTITQFIKLDKNFDLIHESTIDAVCELPPCPIDEASFDSLPDMTDEVVVNYEDNDEINIDEELNDTIKSVSTECEEYNRYNKTDGLVNFHDNLLSTILSDADNEHIIHENKVDDSFNDLSDTDSWTNPLDIVPMWEIKDPIDNKVVPIIDNSGDLDTSEEEEESEEEEDCLTDVIESEMDDFTHEDSKLLTKVSIRDKIEAKLINMVGNDIFYSWMEQLNYFKNDSSIDISIDTFQLEPQPSPEELMLIFKLLYLLDQKPM